MLRSQSSRHGLRLLVMLLVLMLPLSASAGETVLKIATLAPRGSVWMRYFTKMKAEIERQTDGAVKLRFYPGHVQGDERDVVRKMRTGQLHGGAFTSVGLAMINPLVLVLQLPMMFSSYEQVDRVRKELAPQFERSFTEKGYVLLGWGEVGWIHVFSKNKVGSIAELKKQRMWAMTDDPIAKAMLRGLGIKPRLMGLPQVYPALTTGMVDAVYNSPYGCMALQWHSKLKYMTATPLALGTGATVVSKKAFDALSPQHQQKVLSLARRYHRALLQRIRRDNDKARQLLTASGIKVVKVSNSDRRAERRVARDVARSFAPRYYPKAILDKVLALL